MRKKGKYVFFLCGIIIDRLILKQKIKRKIEKEKLYSNKLQEFYELLVSWLELQQRGGTLEYYFEKNKYRNIAIYGMKELGEALCLELKNTEIRVNYLIDKNADSIYSEKNVYLPNDELPETDVIVVTAIHYYNEIKKELSTKVKYPIINLRDIVYESLEICEYDKCDCSSV